MPLHRCPPLNAWMSDRACRAFAALGARARRAPVGSELRFAGHPYRLCCDGCPGVVALGAGTREMPEVRVTPPARKGRPRISRTVGDFVCPENLITVEMLMSETEQRRSNVYARLKAAGVKPERPHQPLQRLPALYPRAEAVRACRRRSA